MENQPNNYMRPIDRDLYEAGKQGIKLQGGFPDQRARDFYDAGQQGLNITPAAQPAQPGFMDAAFTTAKGVAGDVSDFASEQAGILKSAFTGEGRTEYPDMPEITEANIGFFESFMPNMKLGLTMDPNEKAKIIQNTFQSDPRFGGVYEDAQGNPIVEWEGQPYYVNKPGASMQDLNDVVAQAAQFTPGAKVASGANTLAGRLASGAATYGATDLAQQRGVMAAGGKDNTDLGQTATVAGVGGAAEAFVPPALKAAGKVARGAVEAGRRAMFPRYVPKAPGGATASQTGAIPMTQGQRAGDMNLLRKEEAARQGGYGETASGVMRNFDDRQLDAIRSEADTLQPGRSGFDTQSPTDIGSELQGRLIDEAGRRKAAVNTAYDDAARMSQDAPALINREGIAGMARDLASVPRDMNIDPMQVAQMPNLKSALQRAKDTATLATNPRFKAQNFTRIEGSRKALNRMIDSATDKTERAALVEMKRRMDDWTDRAITEGFMEGDTATIDALKNARGLAADYFKNFGKGNSMDPAGSAMVKLLDENAATPLQMVEWLTGAARTKANPRAVGLVKRMQGIFGPDSQEIGLLKDAYLMKAFTGVSRGNREVTREAIVKGGRNLIDGDGKQIAETLFTPQEIGRIRQLINETAKTITPQDARNPSRSAFAMMQLLRDNNLLSMGGKAVGPVPLVGELGKAMKEAGGGITARNLTSQAERLIQAPMVEAGAAASALAVEGARRREIERRNRETPGPSAMAPQTPQQALASMLSNPPGQPQNVQQALMNPNAPQGRLSAGLLGLPGPKQGRLSPDDPKGLLADALMRR